ncbi:MAG TPA: four helix bundle protein [Desulfobulbaceae bacterium]|nr:four helix bundle protein [Desulfobulbaceae bacterium]
MNNQESLIPKHGGYRRLKSFQIAQLVYDVTVRFCDRYIDRRSRTHDQMVQAARSGVQNIAEGSIASGTSKKTELKLTNVARASLEELRLDYEDFLRQRGLPQFEPEHPTLQRFKAKRCATLDDVRAWVEEELNMMKHGQAWTAARINTDTQTSSDRRNLSVSAGGSPCVSVDASVLVANAALSLLNLCCYLFDRQIARQAEDFENEGGFTERLYRVRTARRKNKYKEKKA